MKKLMALVASLLLFSSSAWSVSDTNRTIATFGTQNGVAFVTLSPAQSGTCLYNVLYLNGLDTTAGKTMYAALLTAVSADKTLTRIDYAAAADGVCYVSLVQF